MSAIKTLIGVLVFVGCIALIITLAVVLSRDRHDCGIISSDISITEFTFTTTTNGVVVEWPRPAQLSGCHPRYEVTYNSTKGTFSSIVELESVEVPDDTFCFEFDMTIRALATISKISGGRTSYYDERPISVEYFVSIINPTAVTIIWTHPNYDWCFAFQFMVTYETASGTQVVDAATSQAVFNFEYCMPSTVTIWPINPNDGNLLSHQSATTIDATQYPSTADGRNVSIRSYDDRLEISWSVASSSELCEFNYVADFITDMGTHTIHTQEPSIIFTRDLFCFKGAVIIRALIQENSFEVVNTAWEYGMPNVTGIVVTASSEESSLTATWTSNPLEAQCNIIYEATFENEHQTNTSTVSQPVASADLFYCVNTTVNVHAIHRDIVGTPNGVVYEGEYPSSLPPIETIYVNVTQPYTVVAWIPPQSVESCANVYTVSAEGDYDGDECVGTMSCVLNVGYNCSSIVFAIKPTLPILGEERTATYNCTTTNLL
ncbi:hypothetical protein QE152_g37557 [Popillia japonica]|uniref:Fibronectin type-III domain-containing protein n=1 Tax=Popillia japonica TaxID=7064 RepID=A0AAW1IA38_POPJA